MQRFAHVLVVTAINDRMPLCKGGMRAAKVNNFIYNPGRRIVQFGYVPTQWTGHEPQLARGTAMPLIAG